MFEHQLIVGGTYRFTFKPEFERHGVCESGSITCLHPGNGIFRIEQIATFRDIVLAGIDLYSSFFKPLGFTEDEFAEYFSGKPANSFEKTYIPNEVTTQQVSTENMYDSENKTIHEVQRVVSGTRIELVESGQSHLKRQYFEEIAYGSFPIYKLVDVKDPDDILYAPEKAIKGMPEVNLSEYQNMTIAIDIGYYDNPENLDGVVHALRERLALYGIQPSNISMFSADSQWMNREEYEQCKSIRVPGELVKITDQNAEKYLGYIAVLDGYLKTIVRSSPNERQIAVNSLKSGKLIIDPRLFLEEVPLTDLVFESGKQYFVKGPNYDENTNKNFIKLIEGSSYNPGDEIPHYVKTSDESQRPDKTYYRKSNGGVFAPIDDSSVENNAAAAKAKIEAGVKIYHYVSETITVGTTPASTIEGYSDKDGSVELSVEYVKDHPSELYFIKVADYSYPIAIGPNATDPNFTSNKSNYYEVNPVYVLSSGTDASRSLITKTFSYSNKYNLLVTTELDADKLSVLAFDESSPVMISNEIVRNKYNNRWFEFSILRKANEALARECTYYRQDEDGELFDWLDMNESDADKYKKDKFSVHPDIVAGQTLPTTLNLYREEKMVVIIGSTNFSNIRDVKGVVVGEYGEAYKEVFIKNDTLNKNYYALYIEEIKNSAQLAEENVRLKELLARMSESSN